ncbi:MAG: molybdenum cofactor guanylyltransferase [Deltaproteobacteria bacterium]|nr:molybdenum cofactor guanylyltransferase [Deltaproteobacteria bacterium]
MGTNKAFLEIDGERLIDRTVRIFREIFDEIILVTNSPLEYLDQDVDIVTDIYKGKGALGGIFTGIFYASGSRSFVAACDMPYLNRSFIEHMIRLADAYDVVVPRTAEGYQPLHAIYSKNCLAPIKKLLLEDRLKVSGFFKGRKLLMIGEEILRGFDPEGMMFFNVNTKEDLGKLSAESKIR